MFNLSWRMVALAAIGFPAAIVTGQAAAQLSPIPAAPRQDTERTEDTEDTEPSGDSRAGRDLSGESNQAPSASPSAEEAEADARQEEPETSVTVGEGEEIFGEVKHVQKNRLILEVRPKPQSRPREVTFQVLEHAAIVRNGEPSKLTSLKPGDRVKIKTSPGDSNIIVEIVAGEKAKGSLNVVDMKPKEDEGGRKPIRQGLSSVVGGEEAVLPLGIEVFGANQAALVTELLPRGPAGDAGVQIGDLIVAINGQPIPNTEGIETMLAKSPGGAELTIRRGGQTLTATVRPWAVADGALIQPAAIRRAFTGFDIVIPLGTGAGAAEPTAPIDGGVAPAPDGEGNANDGQGTPQTPGADDGQPQGGNQPNGNQPAENVPAAGEDSTTQPGTNIERTQPGTNIDRTQPGSNIQRTQPGQQ